MSVLLPIESSVASAAVCSQVGLQILHRELGRPAHPVTPTSGHRLHHVELCLRKTERKEQEYVLQDCLRKGGRRGLNHGQHGLFPKLSIREKAFPFPSGGLGYETESVSVFKICPSWNRNQEKYERLIFNLHRIWSYNFLVKIVSGPSSL